jgi:hypothetical protein
MSKTLAIESLKLGQVSKAVKPISKSLNTSNQSIEACQKLAKLGLSKGRKHGMNLG